MENTLFDVNTETKKDFNDLIDIYFMAPFSIINTIVGRWHKRKRYWMLKGIESEVGRGEYLLGKSGFNTGNRQNNKGGSLLNNPNQNNTSVFDPVLCELMYNWFAPDNAKILDPFAGGSVRGIVASCLGHCYTGIELRDVQVKANNKQGHIITPNNIPKWICGDSDKELDFIDEIFDIIFTCPPYLNLEKYSSLESDLSNMNDNDFYYKYKQIIKKSISKVKDNGLIIFVVGDVRDSHGFYKRFPDKTKDIIEENNCKLLNEIHFYANGNAALRANKSMQNKKVVKIHQTIIVFQKIPMALKKPKRGEKK